VNRLGIEITGWKHYDNHQIECAPQCNNRALRLEKHYNRPNINIMCLVLMAGLITSSRTIF